MPFALLIIGIILLVAAVRDSQDDLFKLVKGDFTGPNNFVFWVVSLLIIGAVGYIPKLKPISVGFLTLVLLVLFLSRGNPQNATSGGFFEKFTAAIKGTQSTSTASAPATAQTVSDNLPALPTLQNLGGIQSV